MQGQTQLASEPLCPETTIPFNGNTAKEHVALIASGHANARLFFSPYSLLENGHKNSMKKETSAKKKPNGLRTDPPPPSEKKALPRDKKEEYIAFALHVLQTNPSFKDGLVAGFALTALAGGLGYFYFRKRIVDLEKLKEAREAESRLKAS